MVNKNNKAKINVEISGYFQVKYKPPPNKTIKMPIYNITSNIDLINNFNFILILLWTFFYEKY